MLAWNESCPCHGPDWSLNASALLEDVVKHQRRRRTRRCVYLRALMLCISMVRELPSVPPDLSLPRLATLAAVAALGRVDTLALDTSNQGECLAALRSRGASGGLLEVHVHGADFSDSQPCNRRQLRE